LGYICACRGDELIGFVNLAWDGGSHAFVLGTTVHPNFRRRGVGRRLVKLAVEVVRRALAKRPREEWIAESVPDSGIPREWVEAAREAVEANRGSPSANGRFWELSGGLLRCALCGGKMRPQGSLGRRSPEARYFYYRCGTQWDNGSCPHKKLHRAGDTERRVWAFVRGLFGDPERLRADLERMRHPKSSTASRPRSVIASTACSA
jgi:GNAT superfamily N-acetyltransferase